MLTGARTQLDTLPLKGFSAFDLAWSPNGKDLAFTASYETPDGFAFDVFGVSNTWTCCATSLIPASRSAPSGHQRQPRATFVTRTNDITPDHDGGDEQIAQIRQGDQHDPSA